MKSAATIHIYFHRNIGNTAYMAIQYLNSNCTAQTMDSLDSLATILAAKNTRIVINYKQTLIPIVEVTA